MVGEFLVLIVIALAGDGSQAPCKPGAWFSRPHGEGISSEQAIPTRCRPPLSLSEPARSPSPGSGGKSWCPVFHYPDGFTASREEKLSEQVQAALHWLDFLPVLSSRVSLGEDWTRWYSSAGGYRLKSYSGLTVGLSLTWGLGRASSLRRENNELRALMSGFARRRRARISDLLSRRRDICLGPHGPSGSMELEAVDELLRMILPRGGKYGLVLKFDSGYEAGSEQLPNVPSMAAGTMSNGG